MHIVCFGDTYMKQKESILVGKWSSCSLASTFPAKNGFMKEGMFREQSLGEANRQMVSSHKENVDTRVASVK